MTAIGIANPRDPNTWTIKSSHCIEAWSPSRPNSPVFEHDNDTSDIGDIEDQTVAATAASASLYAGFVFFIFGFGTKRQHLGPGQTRTCPHCHNTTQWTRIREFKQFTLFFIPIARWKRRELEQCGICGTATEA